MRNCWNKLLAITVMSLTISLAGLVVSGPVLAQRGQVVIPQCVDKKNGTVTDNSTGLMWEYYTTGPVIWESAMNHASTLSLGGHSDWRLPERGELLGLYNSECKEMMHVQSSTYWSATSDASNTHKAWRVDFSNGSAYFQSKYNNHYVRAVRTAPAIPVPIR